MQIDVEIKKLFETKPWKAVTPNFKFDEFTETQKGYFKEEYRNKGVGVVMMDIWRENNWDKYTFVRGKLLNIQEYANLLIAINAARLNMDNGPPFEKVSVASSEPFIDYNGYKYDDTYDWVWTVEVLAVFEVLLAACCTILCCYAGGAVCGYYLHQYATKNAKLNDFV